MILSRRTFLKETSLAAASSLIAPVIFFPQTNEPSDAAICKEKFAWAASQGLNGKSIREVMAAIGQSFLEAPYKAHTLEASGPERLIVNLRQFDCVTFVETTLALSRCIKSKRTTFDEFKKQLQLIRYRNGIIDGYPSRLHYFTDWIDDNEKKQIVRNVTRDLGGVSFDKKIDFMSTHRTAYKALKDKSFFTAIKGTEAALGLRQHSYVPKDRVQTVREQIFDGDIVGITTTVAGLDIAHTGIACRFQGILRFLHAPLSGGTVQITKRSLVDHLGSIESHTGIVIARPIDPES